MMTMEIHEAAERLERLLRQAVEESERVRGLLKAAEEEERMLRAALKPLRPNSPLLAREPKEPKPEQKKPRVRSQRPTDETIAKVRGVMRPYESVSVPEVARKAGISPTTARQALNVLRDNGEVRLAGMRHSGETGRAPVVYALMNGNGDEG